MLPYPNSKYGYTKEEVLAICRERKIHHAKFWKAFGVNTCMVEKDGSLIYYVCDVERALHILGNKDGVDHIWD